MDSAFPGRRTIAWWEITDKNIVRGHTRFPGTDYQVRADFLRWLGFEESSAEVEAESAHGTAH